MKIEVNVDRYPRDVRGKFRETLEGKKKDPSIQ